MSLLDKLNQFFSKDDRTQDHSDTNTESPFQNRDANSISEELVWPSHKGFALDANHGVPKDNLSADEWKSIQEDIAAYDDAQYIEDIPSPLDDEKYDPDVITLPAGTILMRYGQEDGTFLTDPGTSIDQCALPLDQYEVHYYILNEPYDVHAGIARPWFGKEGGGAQYKTLEGKTPIDLIDSGVFSRCDVDGNRADSVESSKSVDGGNDTDKTSMQTFVGKIKGEISDFVHKNAQKLFGVCVAVNMLSGVSQLNIDLKKIENDIDSITKIEQIADAFADFQDKVADDDIADALEKSNQKDDSEDDVLQYSEGGDSPDKEEEYEQLSFEGFDDVDLSDELGSNERTDTEELDSIDDMITIDLQKELGDRSECDGQIGLFDSDEPVETNPESEVDRSIL